MKFRTLKPSQILKLWKFCENFAKSLLTGKQGATYKASIDGGAATSS